MPSDITVFAETNFRNQRRKFGIKVDDRRRHMYVVGKTGMGKSTLLENMVVTDIRAGHGLAVVDPHGDLAEKILSFIPNDRVNDVIYFNPSDTQFPIAFNILETIGPEYKHLVAYGLVGVFKKIWADSWGPRMEYIMTNTILALLDYPGSTLLGVMRMLVDKAYRKKVVSKVTDPVIKTFWADEFANYSEKFRTEAIAPIQNKIGQFLASSIIRNIVGQSKSTIEMREIMDGRKILIMNLAKGRIGEENSALLGAMMITKLQIAAMSRVDIVEEERKDFFLYVDEFQNFATDSFAGILSEARKYRLCLIMAHQYFEQLNDVVKAAVFGNVGTLIVFRVGATDAAELELEFAPQFMPADIVNLKKYTFCMRLMVDGVATEPFSAIGLPPVTGTTDNTDKVIRVSRERYARPQNLVEDRIIRWSGVEVARPQGQTSPTLNADEFSDNDFGDDDVEDANVPVATADSQESKAVQSTKLKQSANPNLIKSEEDSNFNQPLGVDLSKLIPGEQARPIMNAPTAKVTLANDSNDAELESVTMQAPAEHFLTQAPPRTRPKINFVAPMTEALTAQPSDSVAAPALATTVTPSQPPAPKQSAPSPAKATPASVIKSAIPVTPAANPSNSVRPMPQPAVSTPGPGLSLKSLQTGTAPQVSFKAINRPTPSVVSPITSSASTPSSTSSFASPVVSKPPSPQKPSAPVVTPKARLEPMPNQLPQQASRPMSNAQGTTGSSPMSGSNQSLSTMSGAKKRKRKRKRKPGQPGSGAPLSGGGSGQGQGPQVQTQSQSRPPVSPQPQRQPFTQHQTTSAPPVRPAASQTPPPPKPIDSTKVSLKDLV